jgi:hypothetical protein
MASLLRASFMQYMYCHTTLLATVTTLLYIYSHLLSVYLWQNCTISTGMASVLLAVM